MVLDGLSEEDKGILICIFPRRERYFDKHLLLLGIGLVVVDHNNLMGRRDKVREVRDGGTHPVSSMYQLHKGADGGWCFHIIECFILSRITANAILVDDSATELNLESS